MKFGECISNLPPQFEIAKGGKTLIIDGDSMVYVVAATVKRLPTAIRRMQQEILTALYYTQCSNAVVHLTSALSYKRGRFNVKAFNPYQGNRDGKSRPPLVEPLREAIANEDNMLDAFDVRLHYYNEADDGVMIDAYSLKDKGVVWSADKDLRMTPYPFWESKTGSISIIPDGTNGHFGLEYTESGLRKATGRGRIFFWGQMLCGDTADGIRGLDKYYGKNVGLVAADSLLRNVTEENSAADIVLSAYRDIDQNPLAEGYLLWLPRTEDDTFEDYLFSSLKLSKQNKQYVDKWRRRKDEWFETV